MTGQKTYTLIVLANHQPSQDAEKIFHEYLEEKSYVKVGVWRVTNNYSLKDFRKKFKFEDLPCLHISQRIATNKYKKENYYGEDIERQCREHATRAMRKESAQRQRERSASLRLRLSRNPRVRKYQRDVIPASDDAQENADAVSSVSKTKG